MSPSLSFQRKGQQAKPAMERDLGASGDAMQTERGPEPPYVPHTELSPAPGMLQGTLRVGTCRATPLHRAPPTACQAPLLRGCIYLLARLTETLAAIQQRFRLALLIFTDSIQTKILQGAKIKDQTNLSFPTKYFWAQLQLPKKGHTYLLYDTREK